MAVLRSNPDRFKSNRFALFFQTILISIYIYIYMILPTSFDIGFQDYFALLLFFFKILSFALHEYSRSNNRDPFQIR